MLTQEPTSTSKAGPKLPQGKSLRQHLQDYLRWQRIEGYTQATRKHKQVQLGMFLRWLEEAGHTMMAPDLTPMDVTGHLADMREKGLSPNTIATRLRSIRAWVHWLQEWEVIQDDPCKRIRPPRLPRVRKQFLSEEQFQAILNVCPANTFLGDRDRALLWLLLTSGMRLQEVAGLRQDDLDWEREIIWVFGKGQKQRHVPFVKEAQRAMLRYLRHRHDSLPCLWVTEERDRPLQYRGINSRVAALQKRAGVSLQDACHVFRRTAAVGAVRQNIPRPYIRAKFGWTSDQMIERYTGWMEEEEAEANEAFRDFSPFRK